MYKLLTFSLHNKNFPHVVLKSWTKNHYFFTGKTKTVRIIRTSEYDDTIHKLTRMGRGSGY